MDFVCRSERFQAALENSRFCGVAPERLLELYFDEPMIGKREALDRQKRQQEELLEIFRADFSGTPALTCGEQLTELVKGQIHKGLAEWERCLRLSATLYNRLPYRSGQKEYLAVFAARITGNPHAFDRGTSDGQLLDQVIRLDLALRDRTVTANEVFPSYQRQRSWLEAGIMVDDVSNYTMLCGVRAKKADGRHHAGFDGFWKERDILQAPLAVLAELERIECPNRRMYIVENPSIFAMLCGSAVFDGAFMCMNGQPRLAGLIVLELLAKAKTEVFYAGDLDPEGLLIAQKLSMYYRGDFHFWHMTVRDYRRSRSEEVISDKRLKMLDRISARELLPVKEELLRQKRAAYQERVFDFTMFDHREEESNGSKNNSV